jgi:hypothetical protein
MLTMQLDDSDREQIDLLVRELTTKPLATRAVPATTQPPVHPASERVPGAQPIAQPAEHRPVGRWTNVRLLMPAARTPGLSTRFAFGSAMSLPQLPDLHRFFRMPGPVTLVRMWVGLSVVHSAAMTFWPYPKTYFWGLVLYILSLGLALVAGVWGARLSWDSRLGAAHTVSLSTVLWAVTLGATETLPPI